MASVFTYTPGTWSSDFDTNLITGNDFSSAVTGTITGVYIWSRSDGPSSVTVAVHRQSDQVLMTSQAASMAQNNAYNLVTLSSPVAYSTPGEKFTISYISTGFFVYKQSLTNTTTGDLTAYVTAPSPGRWLSGGSAGQYPTNTDPGTGYGVGMEFTASAGSSIAPGGIAVPVALGSPSLAWSGTVTPAGIATPVALGSPTAAAQSTATPDGIAVPVALGSPSLTWSASVSPDGISVPVALGSPIVGAASINPDGITVPVTLGNPTLTWSGTIAPDGIPVAVALGSPSVSIPGSVVTRPFTGTVTRPSTGIVARPSIGTVTRPTSGIVTRPDTGVVSRP